MGLDLRQVQYFIAVAQHGSLGRAAQDLGVTQPALSTGLARLERTLGARLLERRRAGSTLTPQGSAFLPHARAMAEAARRAQLELDALGHAGPARLGIGCGPSLALRLVPDAIARLRRQRVRLAVRVVEGTFDALLPHLERGDIDLLVGTVSEDLAVRGLVGETLFHDSVGIVAARNHPLAGARGAGLADCRDARWVLPPAGDRLRRWLGEQFAAEGLVPPEPLVETGSTSVIRALLLRDQFLSVMPLQLASADAGIQALRIARATWERSVNVVHRGDRELPAHAQRFVACLRSVASVRS